MIIRKFVAYVLTELHKATLIKIYIFNKAVAIRQFISSEFKKLIFLNIRMDNDIPSTCVALRMTFSINQTEALEQFKLDFKKRERFLTLDTKISSSDAFRSEFFLFQV